MPQFKNANDVIYAVAKRAKELGNEKMNALRAINGYGCETQSEAVQLHKHKDRGTLIEEILTEEFTEEFPQTFYEE